MARRTKWVVCRIINDGRGGIDGFFDGISGTVPTMDRAARYTRTVADRLANKLSTKTTQWQAWSEAVLS